MDFPTKRFLEFGPFRVDTGERRLFRNGAEIPLTPKVYDLLETLVDNHGHTIKKEDLLDRVWGETIVEENSLTRNISILRKTLGGDPVTGSYIKTVPKRGYRFEADLHVVLEDEEEMVVERRTNYSFVLHDRKNGRSTSRSLLPTRAAWTRPTVLVLGVAILTTIVLGAVGIGVYTGRAPTAVSVGDTTVDSEALELYRRGRELWQTRRGTDLHEATLLLERSVEKDPGFALAHSALADAYAFDLGRWQFVEGSAKRAIEIDGELGEPYASIGFVELFWKWNLPGAEDHFRRAIARSPDYATAHQWYAIKLALEGNFNASLAEINRAVELEPTSGAINADLCQVLYIVQRLDEAEAQCRKTLSLDPENLAAHRHLHDIYVLQGRNAEALEEFIKSEKLAVNSSTVPEQLTQLRSAFESKGISGFWKARLANAGAEARGIAVAKWHALLGDKDKAMLALRRSYEKRDFEFPLALSDPVLTRCCSDDPRFIELRERYLGLR